MSRIISLSFGALVAFTTIALAHAGDAAMTGAWKLSMGANDAPCTLTLVVNPDVSDAGPANAANDCGDGLAAIGHWRTLGSRLELSSGSGELIALLKANGASFAGTRIADGRKIALDR
jgi:hypothetical protein